MCRWSLLGMCRHSQVARPSHRPLRRQPQRNAVSSHSSQCTLSLLPPPTTQIIFALNTSRPPPRWGCQARIVAHSSLALAPKPPSPCLLRGIAIANSCPETEDSAVAPTKGLPPPQRLSANMPLVPISVPRTPFHPSPPHSCAQRPTLHSTRPAASPPCAPDSVGSGLVVPPMHPSSVPASPPARWPAAWSHAQCSHAGHVLNSPLRASGLRCRGSRRQRPSLIKKKKKKCRSGVACQLVQRKATRDCKRPKQQTYLRHPPLQPAQRRMLIQPPTPSSTSGVMTTALPLYSPSRAISHLWRRTPAGPCTKSPPSHKLRDPQR
jgi:hypothetical protein